MALYVYGLMRARDAHAVGDRIGRVPISSVEHGGLAALVSLLPEGEIRIRRDNVVAHSDVLQAAFEHGPVLPLRFGSVLRDGEAVIGELIAPAAEQLAARLDALDGKVEMQIKAVYMEEPLLRSILRADPVLARSATRMRGQPAAATHFERIRIGEAVAGAVGARRAGDHAKAIEALSPHAIAVSVSDPHHERSALNVAFLVDRGNLRAFDAAVERLSVAQAADTEFKLLGPLPPYSFVDRDWERTASTEVTGAWA